MFCCTCGPDIPVISVQVVGVGMPITMRVKLPSGSCDIQVESNTTAAELKSKIESKTAYKAADMKLEFCETGMACSVPEVAEDVGMPITMRVKLPSGSCDIQVESSTTAAEMKSKIESKTAYKASDMKLEFCGSWVENGTYFSGLTCLVDDATKSEEKQ